MTCDAEDCTAVATYLVAIGDETHFACEPHANEAHQENPALTSITPI